MGDPFTYLNLCRYLFPEMENYFLEIDEMDVSPADKLNLLLDLLSEVLEFNLTDVDGAEILRFNFSHIDRLIVVLELSSRHKPKPPRGVRSHPHSEDEEVFEKEKEKSRSARGPPSDQNPLPGMKLKD